MTTGGLHPEPILHFDNFPFFVGVRESDELADLPSHLPFSLYVDPDMAVPRLVLSPEIEAALNKAYGLGSMLSTPLGQSGPAKDRLHEMLSGLLAAFGSGIEGKRFLEIGCGSGDLLNTVRKKGAQVTGCEIGPQGEKAAQRYGFEVVRSPLRQGLFDEPFDCIFSYGCLEHIADLRDFFASCRANLKHGGLFFHSVPNMESSYAKKGSDDLCHEHVNYFSPQNGARLFEAQGFQNARAKPTDAGNEVHIWGYFNAEASPVWPFADQADVAAETDRLQNFAAAIQQRLERGKAAIEAMLTSHGSVGFYGGGHTLGGEIRHDGDIRYYDGDSYKHGKCWLAGLPPIRDPATLRDDPVDDLIICPDHYFVPIRNHLVNAVGIPQSVRIHRLSEI